MSKKSKRTKNELSRFNNEMLFKLYEQFVDTALLIHKELFRRSHGKSRTK